MRIAMLSRRFDPSGGGTERDLIVTARCLMRAGHDVTVYADEVRGEASGISVRRVGGVALPRALALLRFGYGAGAAARRDGADLVLSFARVVDADAMRSGGGPHTSYIRAAARWRGAFGAASMRLAPYHRVQMHLERRGFTSRRMRKAIAVSNFVRDDLIREFRIAPERAVTLYNGVDLDRFRPAPDDGSRDAIRFRFGIPRTATMVVFVGNGFARKGLGYLIDAWPMAPADSYLLVVGTDRDTTAFRTRAEGLGVDSRVKFAGGQSDVERIFRAADAFAMPSLFEPFGNVVMEAMACGIPALSSAWCGVAELMPPEMRVCVVENPTDPGEIALRLGEMLDARSKLGPIARATAEQFTWDRYARELEGIIESIAP